MDLPIFTVDSFTNQPFSGNPSGVCLIRHGLEVSDGLLQKIASEMNISETAYIQQLTDQGDFSTNDKFKLRWLTPTNEVDLCGHGTLAAAAVVFFCQGNKNETLTFESRSGALMARRDGDGITLDFPLNPVQPYSRDDAAPIIKEVCDPALVTDVQYSPRTQKLVLRLKDGATRETLEGITADIRAMHANAPAGIKGVIVTVHAEDGNTGGYDFYSRYYAPWNGIPEDPVTGSAHTVLADYWSKQLNKTSFKARQCSKRGGDLLVKILGGRVELTGQATVVLRGSLLNLTN